MEKIYKFIPPPESIDIKGLSENKCRHSEGSCNLMPEESLTCHSELVSGSLSGLPRMKGFSLAEAMVMLVVISILLAVSAPLIAKKSNADQRRLVVQGLNSSVVTAMGNNQNFGIGESNIPRLEDRGRAKLYVTAGRRLANFVSTIAGDGVNANTTEIFNVTPESHAANQNGFKVFADGTTNVRTCVPDWDREILIANNDAALINNSYSGDIDLENLAQAAGNYNKTYLVTEDGYVSASRKIRILYKCNNTPSCDAYKVFVPSLKLDQNETNIKGTGTNQIEAHYIYHGAIVVPVQKDNRVAVYSDNNVRDDSNSFSFIPCAQPTR